MKYQLFDPLTDDEYADLKADIAARGVMVPVEVDENGDVLDGHHRVRACEELGITDYPTIVREGMTEAEKRYHVRKLNLARRHLTKEKRDAQIIAMRQEGNSYRAIAEASGFPKSTVVDVIKQVSETGHLPNIITGTDGKEYPATRRTHRDVARELNAYEDEYHRPVYEEDDERDSNPHVSHNSGENEWYTPAPYIEAARATMGGIDLVHYRDYLRVNDESPYEVWLLFLHQGGQAKDSPPNSPAGLFGGSLGRLRDCEHHRHGNWGKGGVTALPLKRGSFPDYARPRGPR